MDRRHFMICAAAAGMAGPADAQSAPLAPDLPERLRARVVRVPRDMPAGYIHVHLDAHLLYWTLGDGQAIRYGVGLGRAGRSFRGMAQVGRKATWPRWTPTPAMIADDPGRYRRYAKGMPGGPGNPLGARALYLFRDGRDTLYRIHGTTAPDSIGQSLSAGCIRMHNAHVTDLYARVPVGTPVYAYGG